MKSDIFSGTIPALMTPCKADRTPDFDTLVAKAKQLIGLGMSAVVYCGSMGDWPLLTNEWRMEGVERLVVEPLRRVPEVHDVERRRCHQLECRVRLNRTREVVRLLREHDCTCDITPISNVKLRLSLTVSTVLYG